MGLHPAITKSKTGIPVLMSAVIIIFYGKFNFFPKNKK